MPRLPNGLFVTTVTNKNCCTQYNFPFYAQSPKWSISHNCYKHKLLYTIQFSFLLPVSQMVYQPQLLQTQTAVHNTIFLSTPSLPNGLLATTVKNTNCCTQYNFPFYSQSPKWSTNHNCYKHKLLYTIKFSYLLPVSQMFY